MTTTVKAVAGAIISFLVGLHTAIKLLLIAMIGDILTGLTRSVIAGTTSSETARVGMTRKAVMLIVVAISEIVSAISGITAPTPWGDMWTLGALVACYYAVAEAISIVENVKSCGVPVPQFLVKMLEKLRDETRGSDS
jgi:toxin secretion/phage lysis holin